MMHHPITGDLGRAFRISTEAAVHQRFLLRRQEEERRRERKEEARNDDAELMDLTLAVVASSDLAEFRIELDRYDAAAIAALQENERALIEVRERLDAMLAKAHVLPDGRRVFKTEDGLRVFDEHGNEVDVAIIDPDMIEDWRPRAEGYLEDLERAEVLNAERDIVIAYQQKLDDAREHLDAGDLTQDEFDRLREDLKLEMPDAVREQIPELAAEKPGVAQAEPAASQSHDTALVIDDDMVPTSPPPPGMAPGFSG